MYWMLLPKLELKIILAKYDSGFRSYYANEKHSTVDGDGTEYHLRNQ